MPPGCSKEKSKEYNDMISCTVVVSVSASCSRYYNLVLFSHFPHIVLLIPLIDYTLVPYFILVYIA